MEIYVLIDGKPQGPYTPELVRKYLAGGQLKPTDTAAYAGSADWKPLATLVQSWNRPGMQSAAVPSAKNPKVAIAIGIGAAALLILGAIAFVVLKPHHSTGGGVIAGLPGSRMPTSPAELNTFYTEPPEGQNAATFYVKAFDAYQFNEADGKSKDLPIIGDGTMPPVGTPLPAANKVAMAAFVQKNDAYWAALEQGAAFDQARYPVDLNPGFDTLLPHLAKIKRSAQFAQLKATLAADDNQPKAAADAVFVSLAVADSLKTEPTLISQLVRVACIAIDTASLENALNSVSFSREDLERLATAFAKEEAVDRNGEGFTRAMVGEKVISLQIYDLPLDKLATKLREFENNKNLSSAAAQKMMENLEAQRAFALETFDHALEMRQEPFPDRIKLDEYFPQRANEARRRGYLLCHLLFSGFGSSTHREARGLATLRLAQTAIALERYRLENGGNYPNSLSALVPKYLPEVPIDPAKGEKMHYEKTGQGYEVTSSPINSPKPLSIKVTNPPKPAA